MFDFGRGPQENITNQKFLVLWFQEDLIPRFGSFFDPGLMNCINSDIYDFGKGLLDYITNKIQMYMYLTSRPCGFRRQHFKSFFYFLLPWQPDFTMEFYFCNFARGPSKGHSSVISLQLA